MSTEAFWAEKAKSVETALLTRIPENKVRPRLEPTRRAVELLGDPQRAYRVIHVTGTNGKTSTTRFIERLLREHGLVVKQIGDLFHPPRVEGVEDRRGGLLVMIRGGSVQKRARPDCPRDGAGRGPGDRHS